MAVLQTVLFETRGTERLRFFLFLKETGVTEAETNTPAGARRASVSFLIVSLLSIFSGCRAEEIPCEDRGRLHVICGLDNPEDLAALPGTPWVFFGQGYGVEGNQRGSISAMDPADEKVSILFQGGSSGMPVPFEPGWGSRDCPGPPDQDFSPHGIDLARRPDGQIRLLAVNHGGRESIEFFEVVHDGGEPELIWRGCALAPQGAFLNDVVGLRDGGLLTTHMMEYGSNLSSTLKGLLGMDTGFAYRWDPDTGFEILPGSEGALPNGIQISKDGETVFLDLYLASEVRVFDLKTGRVLHTLEISLPDNLTWTPDGKLLVASHLGTIADSVDCMRVRKGACGMSFEIISIDPDTYETQTLFAHSGAPMGAGTAALDIGGELLIGSFASDRLLRVPLANSTDKLDDE